MGVRQAQTVSNTITNANVVTTTETVIATLPPLSPTQDNSTVLINWLAALTTGASTTALQFRLRRGTTVAGTQVGQTYQINVVASAAQFYAGFYFDIPGVIAGQQYVLTVQQVGASTNASVQDVCIGANNP